MKILIKIVFPFLFGAFALYASLKNVDFVQFAKAYQSVPFFIQIAVFICFCSTHVLRCVRWKYLQDDLRDVSFLDIYAMHSVGFLGIFVLPFRLGEFVRPGLLKKKYSTPMSKTLTYVFIERVWDGVVVCLLFFIGINVALKRGLILSAEHSENISFYLENGFYLFCALASFLLLCAWLVNKKQGYFNKHKLWQRYGINMAKALSMMLSSKKILMMFVLSMSVWLLAVAGYWLMFLGYQIHLGVFEAMCILGLLSLGLMIPGPPGFIGTFHFFIQMALSLFSVGVDRSAAYATSLYVINALYIVLSGLFGYALLSISLKDIQNSITKTQDEPCK